MAFRDLMIGVGIDSSGFRAGVAKLRSESAALKMSMGALAGTITDQVRELNKMAKAGDTTSDAFKELQGQIKKNEKAFKDMGREAKWVDTQLSKMEGKGKGFSLGDFGDALTGGLIGGGVAGLALSGAQALGGAFKDTIRVAADFDDQIRKIAATSGETGAEMVKLREAAVDWGAKTSYSSSEAAQAMQYMAQAGWNTQQMLSGLPGVLNLAASSGEDLAMTADIVTNTLTAFKMEASDAGHLADVLAMAAAASNTNVAKMGDTFRYVGPVAGALGFSIEDTALAIGLMANSGIKGEQAGTALRAMFKRLADPTKESKMAMEALGISLTDASGNVKPLEILLTELRNAFGELTPAQQAQRAAQLAGTEAMSGTLALVTASADSFNTLSAQINNATGTAQKMADVMEGGLGGSIRRAQGSWEKFQLSMMEGNGIIQKSADATSGLLDKLSAFASRGLYFATTAEEAAFMTEKYGNSVMAFAKHADIAAFQQEQLQKKVAESAKSIAMIKDLLESNLDWSKLAPPDVAKKGGLPGLAGGGTYTDWAKGQNMMLGATDNTRKAIQEYIKTLQEQRDELEIGSAQYKKIEKEIAKYEARLGKATKATQAAANVDKGPKINIVSNMMGMDEFAMVDLTDKMKKQIEGANILQGIFGNINLLEEETKAVSELIKGGIEAGVDVTVLQPYIDKLKTLESAKLGPQIDVDEQSFQMAELVDKMQKEMKDANLLQAAFGDVNMIATEVQSLGQLISEGLAAGLDIGILQPYIDKWRELNQTMSDQQLSIGIIEQVGSVAMSTFEAIGAGSMSAAQGFAAVGKAALMASLDFLKGKLLESTGGLMKWASSLGPLGIPIATAGVGALFALVKGAIGRTKSVALAEGGIITGRTLAEVGEYPGASFNPEVVAPLDKLQAMLDIGGSTHVTGTFRIQGSDLVLALDNAQRKMSQFRV